MFYRGSTGSFYFTILPYFPVTAILINVFQGIKCFWQCKVFGSVGACLVADNISFDANSDLLHVRYGVLIKESDEDIVDEDHDGVDHL